MWNCSSHMTLNSTALSWWLVLPMTELTQCHCCWLVVYFYLISSLQDPYLLAETNTSFYALSIFTIRIFTFLPYKNPWLYAFMYYLTLELIVSSFPFSLHANLPNKFYFINMAVLNQSYYFSTAFLVLNLYLNS